MLGVRVVPTLLLRDQGLVKGTEFQDHKYVGDPVNAVKIFNTKEADELAFFDITATTTGRGPNYSLLSDIASQAFMPLAYGGGVSSVDEVKKLFRIGFEKIIINTAAIEHNDLISEISRFAGSQSVVVSIDVRKSLLGKYQVYTRSGQFNTKLDPVAVARSVVRAGAGELILCSINREGTGRGYDCSLLRAVADAVDVPIIASGGAGSLEHLRQGVDAGAAAVAAGSMFTFYGKHKAVLITYPDHEQLIQLFK